MRHISIHRGSLHPNRPSALAVRLAKPDPAVPPEQAHPPSSELPQDTCRRNADATERVVKAIAPPLRPEAEAKSKRLIADRLSGSARKPRPASSANGRTRQPVPRPPENGRSAFAIRSTDPVQEARRVGRVGDYRWLDGPLRNHRALLRPCPTQKAAAAPAGRTQASCCPGSTGSPRWPGAGCWAPTRARSRTRTCRAT